MPKMQNHEIPESILEDDGERMWTHFVRELRRPAVPQRLRILPRLQNPSEASKFSRAAIRGPDGGEGGEHKEEDT